MNASNRLRRATEVLRDTATESAHSMSTEEVMEHCDETRSKSKEDDFRKLEVFEILNVKINSKIRTERNKKEKLNFKIVFFEKINWARKLIMLEIETCCEI